MKLISLWEPWASLMAIGAKRVETRTWECSYRGPLAIQASQKGLSKRELRSTLMRPEFLKALENEHLMKTVADSIESFPFGKIVAVVRLQSCWPTTHLFRAFPDILTLDERAFGNYEPGRWAWMTTDLFRIPNPIPFKAKQGLCHVGMDTLFKIQDQGWKP